MSESSFPVTIVDTEKIRVTFGELIFWEARTR